MKKVKYRQCYTIIEMHTSNEKPIKIMENIKQCTFFYGITNLYSNTKLSKTFPCLRSYIQLNNIEPKKTIKS